MRTLVIDNFDSFTFNLVQYLGELGADPIVHRNDAITAKEAEALAPDAIVISPGPGNPTDPKYFGVCADLLLGLSRTTPTLGVCLGLQGFAHVYGGKVVRAPRILHGKASPVFHDGQGALAGVPSPFMAARYHSLVVDEPSLPRDIVVSAWTAEGEAAASGASEDQAARARSARSEGRGVVMGARHVRYPIEGVQFHPESILTEHGKTILRNFLESARR